MSTKPRILIQLDPDKHASAFDAVVAVDAGVDHLVQYSSVMASDVRSLVHGAIFTRGGSDLASTAIFVGGSDMLVGEKILAEVLGSFFGPMRVSVMLDSNGSNSTAAAAVLCCEKHLKLEGCKLLVAAATGPVGRRVCRLGAMLGAHVYVHSRSLSKARALCEEFLADGVASDKFTALSSEQLDVALSEAQAVIACGAAGAQLITEEQIRKATSLKVAVDLNAVPPSGIAGILPTDKAKAREGRTDFGALGAGSLKMKIHKLAIAKLFDSNDQVLDAEQMLAIGRSVA